MDNTDGCRYISMTLLFYPRGEGHRRSTDHDKYRNQLPPVNWVQRCGKPWKASHAIPTTWSANHHRLRTGQKRSTTAKEPCLSTLKTIPINSASWTTSVTAMSTLCMQNQPPISQQKPQSPPEPPPRRHDGHDREQMMKLITSSLSTEMTASSAPTKNPLARPRPELQIQRNGPTNH